MELYELGYGEYEDIIKRMPLTHNILILDENLASIGATSCWFSTKGDFKKIKEEYIDEYGEADFIEI